MHRKARGIVVVVVATIAVLAIGMTAAFACGYGGGGRSGGGYDRYRHVRYVCSPVEGYRHRVMRWDCKAPASTTTVASAPTTVKATTTTVADDPGDSDTQSED